MFSVQYKFSRHNAQGKHFAETHLALKESPTTNIWHQDTIQGFPPIMTAPAYEGLSQAITFAARQGIGAPGYEIQITSLIWHPPNSHPLDSRISAAMALLQALSSEKQQPLLRQASGDVIGWSIHVGSQSLNIQNWPVWHHTPKYHRTWLLQFDAEAKLVPESLSTLAARYSTDTHRLTLKAEPNKVLRVREDSEIAIRDYQGCLHILDFLEALNTKLGPILSIQGQSPRVWHIHSQKQVQET